MNEYCMYVTTKPMGNSLKCFNVMATRQDQAELYYYYLTNKLTTLFFIP